MSRGSHYHPNRDDGIEFEMAGSVAFDDRHCQQQRDIQRND